MASFGWTTRATGYARDSSASAVVLREFGDAYVSFICRSRAIFEHHYLIKILKTEGVIKRIFHSREKRYQTAQSLSIKASSYNLKNGSVEETAINTKNIFTEKQINIGMKDFDPKRTGGPRLSKYCIRPMTRFSTTFTHGNFLMIFRRYTVNTGLPFPEILSTTLPGADFRNF